MDKAYEIIVKDKNGKTLLRTKFDDDCVISVIESWTEPDMDGFRKAKQVYSNVSNEEKRRMLEHSTF